MHAGVFHIRSACKRVARPTVRIRRRSGPWPIPRQAGEVEDSCEHVGCLCVFVAFERAGVLLHFFFPV